MDEIIIPLKKKYKTYKHAGCGKPGAQNSTPKKKTIWAALAAQERKRGKVGSPK